LDQVSELVQAEHDPSAIAGLLVPKLPDDTEEVAIQDNVLKPCSLRTLSRALLAVAWLALAAAPVLAQTKNPDREAYFGEPHVHTSWSQAAWLFGNRLTDPGDAYKYFKGEPIKHPAGYEVKITTPGFGSIRRGYATPLVGY
jgi:hypothetical protein